MAKEYKVSRFDVLQWAKAALDLADVEARAFGKPAPLYAHVSVSYEQLQAICKAVEMWPTGAKDRVLNIDVRGCKFMAWNPMYEGGVPEDADL